MTTRTLIQDLAHIPDGSEVSVSGWVDTVRDQKKVQFVILRDETGSLQLVNPATREGDDAADTNPHARELTESISALTQGSMLSVTGALKHDERVKLGGLELKIASVDVASVSLPELPIAEDSNVDKRMDWRFIDLRRPDARLLFRVQTTFEHAI
ncbi:MAG: OB-fold nucleic acid binding domain-containing protein, partial [Pontimonas sp.]